MDILGNLSKDLTKNLSDLALKVTEEASIKTQKKLDEMLEDTNKKIHDLFLQRPVMHISVDKGDVRELKSTPNACLPRLITNAKLGLYTLMVGPAGCGKTTAAAQLSESLDLQFASVCLTAGASETWLFGRQTPNGFVEGSFSKLYREGGVFLADEIDAADANLLLSINTALSHDLMFNPMSGEMIKKHDKFVFVAAANTNGKGADHKYTGRSRLDAATLDRFVVIEINYDTKLERAILKDDVMFDFLNDLRAQLKTQGYEEFISTRAFKFADCQLDGGVKRSDIIDSMIATWGDTSKKLATDLMKKYAEEARGGKRKKNPTPYREVEVYGGGTFKPYPYNYAELPF